MSQLAKLVEQEAIKRATDAAQAKAEGDEYTAIVAAIHAAFALEWPMLETLRVRQFGTTPPVPIKGRWGAPIACASGLAIEVSPHYANRTYVLLTVTPRKGHALAAISLRTEREHPYKSDDPAIYPGHTPADALVRDFLALVVPYLDLPKEAAP